MREKGIFNLLLKSVKLYFKNIVSFGRIMLFPIFGQILGIFWILGVCCFLVTTILSQVSQDILIKNIPLVILGMLILLVPGFLLFMNSFWAYLISIISTVLLSEDLIKGCKIKKLKEYKISIEQRSKEYVLLLLIISLFWIAGLFGPAMLFSFFALMGMPAALATFAIVFFTFIAVIILLVVSVSICLANQVFAFERYSPLGYLKKSWQIIDKKFSTVLGFIFLFTIFSSLISFVLILPFNLFGITLFIEKIFNDVVLFYMKSVVSFFAVNSEMSSQILLKSPAFFADALITFMVNTLILPFGSVSFTLLYQLLTTKTSGKKKKS